MKRIILTVIMLICISQYSFPQNNSNYTNPAKAGEVKDIGPALTFGSHTPSEVLQLPEVRKNISEHFIARLKSTLYVPVKVTIDDNTRIIYNFTPHGYLENSLTQSLSNGTWVNAERSSSLYGPRDELLLYTDEVWTEGKWVLKTRQTMTYNEEGNLVLYVLETSPDGIKPAVNAERWSYLYEQSGRNNSKVMEVWMTDTMMTEQWVNALRYSYTYSSSYCLLTHTMENWRVTEWELNSKRTFTYNVNNMVTSMLLQALQNGAMADVERDTYKYDGNGNIIEEIVEMDVNGHLQNDSRTTITYTGNKMASNTTEVWSTEKNSWMYLHRYLYTYEADSAAVEQLDNYQGESWVPFFKVRNVYDQNGSSISKVTTRNDISEWVNIERSTSAYEGKNLLWNLVELGRRQSWVNWKKTEYKYTDGNAVEGRFFGWVSEMWLPVPGSLDLYFNNYTDWLSYSQVKVVLTEYSPVTGVESESNSKAKQFSLSQNYPNPFNPSTTINYTLNKEGNVKLTIYDVLGTKVTELVNEFQSAGSHTIKFNASGLSSGIYLYRLESQGMSAVKKFTLIK